MYERVGQPPLLYKKKLTYKTRKKNAFKMLRSAVLVCSCYKENASYRETDIFGEARVFDSFYTLAKTLKTPG